METNCGLLRPRYSNTHLQATTSKVITAVENEIQSKYNDTQNVKQSERKTKMNSHAGNRTQHKCEVANAMKQKLRP